VFPADPRTLENQPIKRDQPYFEVLVVARMSEAQERALRKELRSWRRPDDEFVYELVVVSSELFPTWREAGWRAAAWRYRNE
jgi:arginine decarboxylase